MIGELLNDRYRVLSKLGEGGMGIVYLVEHLGLRRKEAMKVLRPHICNSPMFLNRFRREAHATNRLQHPNIVAVHDFGRLPDGGLYLTTEYAEGDSVDALLRSQGRFELGPALAILAQLADAMDHAHTRGVIHRDLKPANLILVDERGHSDVLKVLDFGLAKIIAPDYVDSVVTASRSEIFGTPAYMSPEQIQGADPTPRIDIYAFGCIAFSLVVGEPPFGGLYALMTHHSTFAPPPVPSERQPGIPAELDALILRCLEKLPENRYQSGAELLAALKQVPGFVDPKVPNRRRRTSVMKAQMQEDVTGEPSSPGVKLSSALGFTIEDRIQVVQRLLAETLIARGNADGLKTALTDISGLERELERIEAEMLANAHQGELVQRAAKDHEASLRFAIGEVSFDRGADLHAVPRGTLKPAEVERILELRLTEIATQTELELGAIADQQVELAAQLSEGSERLAAAHSSLRRLVERFVPRYVNDEQIRALVDRDLALRSLRGSP